MKNIIVLALLVGVIFGLAITSETHTQEAYRVCNTSHNAIDTVLEEECGQLLDKYKLTYTCDFNSNNCKIEDK